jgi:hypothetical protein
LSGQASNGAVNFSVLGFTSAGVAQTFFTGHSSAGAAKPALGPNVGAAVPLAAARLAAPEASSLDLKLKVLAGTEPTATATAVAAPHALPQDNPYTCSMRQVKDYGDSLVQIGGTYSQGLGVRMSLS